MTRFLFTNSFDDFFNDYVFRDSTASMLYRIFYICRSSHRRCSVRKGALRNFAKFTGKHPCQSLFYNKVAGLRPATLSKKRLWHGCFPVNFSKFARTPFLYRTPLDDCFLINVLSSIGPSTTISSTTTPANSTSD